ncbi:hypothetical protein QUB70_14965 [Microcoleus sp. A003_D6]
MKDHAEVAFLETLKRIADLLLSLSTKYIDWCIAKAWVMVILHP